MALNEMTKSVPSEKLINDLLAVLDQVFGYHAGSRPVHAKGVMCSGTFTPSPEARTLTRAPHASRPSTPIVVRFSNFAGIPTVPDNDPNGAGPRGGAVRFYLAEHVHTDIVGHSENGFPVPTGEDFLEFAQALAASGPNAAKPTALDAYLDKHPIAKHFLTAPKPIPVSYSKESYFDVTAFKFINAEGTAKYGRFRIIPDGKNEYLADQEAAKKSPNFLADELTERLAKGPIKMKVQVQIAEPQDNVNDCSVTWPDSRQILDFGDLSITARVNDTDPEMRKIIFDPIPRVDGIEPSDDPIIQVRSQIYLVSGRRRRAASTSS